MPAARERVFRVVEPLLITAIVAVVATALVPAVALFAERRSATAADTSLRNRSHPTLRADARSRTRGEPEELAGTQLVGADFDVTEGSGQRFVSDSGASAAGAAVEAPARTTTSSHHRYLTVDHRGVIRVRKGSPAHNADSLTD